MQSGRIEGANLDLGKPKDWDERIHGKCVTLAVRREVVQGMVTMTSAWIPTQDELDRLNLGASVHLEICSAVHPAVSLAVGEPPK